MNNAKKEQIEALKGEIELKESTLKSAQELFAKYLRGGVGVQMKELLVELPEAQKENLWKRILKNLKKINT